MSSTNYTDEEALVKYGADERAKTLANLYDDYAGRAPCICEASQHQGHSEYCPRAIWHRAAETARLMAED